MLRLFLLAALQLHATFAVSAGLRRQARVQRVLHAHAAAKKVLKVDPPVLTPQTGHNAINPQTATADPALPAKYTDHTVPLMDDAFDSTETMDRDWVIPKDVKSDEMGFEQQSVVEQTCGLQDILWTKFHYDPNRRMIGPLPWSHKLIGRRNVQIILSC